MKRGGGALGRSNQNRNLKLHENGHISYWKGNDMRGVIAINNQTKVGFLDKKWIWFVEVLGEDGK